MTEFMEPKTYYEEGKGRTSKVHHSSTPRTAPQRATAAPDGGFMPTRPYWAQNEEEEEEETEARRSRSSKKVMERRERIGNTVRVTRYLPAEEPFVEPVPYFE